MVVFATSSSEASSPADSDDLTALPPSAKLVYKVLEYHAPLTQSEIRDRTRLSKRTTRHGVSLLKDADLVEERVYVPDARKRIYEPRVVD
ncbi:MarR family transcriptional regulator [Halobacterium yunchengense]|uniref:MarR family transcriptional regulator n=1 Tax=Halobacterium yunchengense TaxID=3108497 RepID=UPI0030085C13